MHKQGLIAAPDCLKIGGLKIGGFSALELMFTVSLAAIIVSLGVPSLQQFRQNRAMSAAVSDLHHHLALARSESVQLNVDVVTCPGSLETGCAGSTDWQNGWIMFLDIDGDHRHDRMESIFRYGPQHAGLVIRATGGRRYLRFTPAGYAPGSNVSIRFCDSRGPAKARKLVISSLGRIRRDRAPETKADQCPGR